MSAMSFDIITKTSTPLSDCGIDDLLLMQHLQDFIVYRIKVWTVRWPECWWYEEQSLLR